MAKQKLFVWVLLFALFSIPVFSQNKTPKTSNQKELALILEKCAEYCEMLSHTVLDFICMEKISQEINPPRRINNYTYDYQMIRKDNIIKDKRILLKENGKKKHEVDAPLKTKRYQHHNIIFGPIGLLAEWWQHWYNYKIIDRRRFKGDKVVVVEATPKYQKAINDLYGKIWIRESDFSIVKIEWDQRSLGNLDALIKDAKSFDATPKIGLYAEYAFEKNGVRFPSKFIILEIYYRRGVRYLTRSRITSTYKDYQFFTVESTVKYQ